ncbi:hypothetical protein IW143_002871 [Coemansia sp. RSA 520]|nr:hypothetical protein IW143_002871 [Coemansia sp. RSA 520]
MTADLVVLDFENAEVRTSDYESLKPSGWLTGEIINFYWTFLERREFRTEPCVLFLGTYTAYRISNAESAAVTDNISAQLSDELNHRQLILIPLNHRSHWSLLVYCRLTRTFYHYDSISKHNRDFAERAAGRFLRVLEPKLKDGFYFKSMQTPQQNNDYDCGIYVLAIAEELARRFINNKRKTRDQGARVRKERVERQPVQRVEKQPVQRVDAKSDVRGRGAVSRDTGVSKDVGTSKDTGMPRDVGISKDTGMSRDTSMAHTMTPSMSAAHVQQLQQRRNHSTPPTTRVPVTSLPASPGRALASDLLMPNFGKPFSGFPTSFSMYGPDYYPPEPLLKGGGSSNADSTSNKSRSSSTRSREERAKMEEQMMEKAGLPRDFWLVTVEDIEYPHCMRRRIRALVLDLQRQTRKYNY